MEVIPYWEMNSGLRQRSGQDSRRAEMMACQASGDTPGGLVSNRVNTMLPGLSWEVVQLPFRPEVRPWHRPLEKSLMVSELDVTAAKSAPLARPVVVAVEVGRSVGAGEGGRGEGGCGGDGEGGRGEGGERGKGEDGSEGLGLGGKGEGAGEGGCGVGGCGEGGWGDGCAGEGGAGLGEGNVGEAGDGEEGGWGEGGWGEGGRGEGGSGDGGVGKWG